MTRCDEFYQKVEKDGNFCGMRADHYRDLMEYKQLQERNSQIRGITESAAMPLIHEQDKEIKAEAIRKVGRAIEHGNIPTEKQVKQLIQNAKVGMERMGRSKNTYSENDAEVEIAKVLRHVIHAGLPSHKLTTVVEKALFEVLTPDGGCACTKEMK